MTSTNGKPQQNSSQSEGKRRIPWPFIAILVVTIVPIVAAYVAYYSGMGVPDETVNNGTLLEPPVNLGELTERAQIENPVNPTEKQWRLLIPVTVPCDEGCRKNLYTTRQVHIRLGEKGTRVERIAVNLAGEEGKQYLESIKGEHPLLEQITVPRADWNAWLEVTNVPADLEQKPYYLLIDQVGFAMMFYTLSHHGNQLLDDIKRVLRYSPE